MKRLIGYLKPYSGWIGLALVLLFVQAMTDLALPDYMADIVNTGVMGGNTGYIWSVGWKMLLVALLGAVASVTTGFFAAKTAAGVARDLRLAVFQKVQHFSNAEYDGFSTASLITRTTNDITQIQTLLVMMIQLLFYAPILGVGGIIKALNESKSMTMIITVAVICLLGVIAVIFSIAIPRFQLIQKFLDRLNLVTRENLDGLLVIKAFRTEKFEAGRFDRASRDLTDTSLFVNRLMVAMMPAMMLIMNMTILAIVWIGSRQVSALNLQVGSMMGFMQYAIQIIMSFLMLAVMFILIPRAQVSAVRVAEVLETELTVLDKPGAAHLPEDFMPTVVFDKVDFRYCGGDENVLHQISFTAQPGKTTAIIGATGSGKSTILQLLLRFYDVTGGRITIDDRDIRDLPQKELRQNIGYVSQKSILFSGDIRSNLTYGSEQATEQEICQAAQTAQAEEFILAKQEGFGAPIAQGGTNVSGGQRQRLAIGRALVKRAPIYLFDDSFSALDVKTDKKLRAALKSSIEGSTILIVAQRISSILDADKIIVLENGTIVGQGTHRQLLKTCEIYREIASSQMSPEEMGHE